MKPESAIKVEGKWQALLSRLVESADRQLVYVIGGNDSGKTTLCRFLADRLSARHPTAYINCDPGQSVIGPPATIGMALVNGEWEGRAGRTGTALRFIGSTSPFGHMLPILTGSARLREKAAEWGARKVILDSSGFIHSPPGMAFQYEMIDLLEPDLIVGLAGTAGDRLGLDRLARNFRKGKADTICLPIHPAVVKRSPEERRAYREAKFREYFRGSRFRTISFRDLGLHGRIPEESGDPSLRGRLVALSDQEHFVLTIGVMDALDLDRKRIRIHAPPFERKKAATLHFGALRIDLSGKHEMW